MSRDLISKATRNEFREVFVSFTLSQIEMIFDAGTLKPRTDYVPAVGGQRRALVEQYYAGIDFSSPTQVKQLLSVYAELMEQLQQSRTRFTDVEVLNRTIEGLMRRMRRDGFEFSQGGFVRTKPPAAVLEPAAVIALTKDCITEHVEKARAKIESGDPSGAIASAYTLVEEFLKELLRKTGTPFKESEGDIRALYGLIAGPLNLAPKSDQLERYLKAILDGLQRQIGGLFELANKASDRHARRYNPAGHHANLAVNSSFTLCEFLLESYEYQRQRKKEGHPH